MIRHRHDENAPEAPQRFRGVCDLNIGGLLSGAASVASAGAQVVKAVDNESRPVQTVPSVSGDAKASEAIKKNREAINETRRQLKATAAQTASRFNSFVQRAPSPRTRVGRYQPSDENTELDKASVSLAALAVAGLLIWNASEGR